MSQSTMERTSPPASAPANTPTNPPATVPADHPAEQRGEHWRRNRLLIRLAAAAVGGGGLALCAAESVGSTVEPTLFIAVGVPLLACLVFVNRRWWMRVISQVLGLYLTCVAVVLSVGGELSDVPKGLTRGGGELLSTQWPTPRWSTVLVVLATVVFVAVALAAEIALHRRWRVLPAVPLILAFVALIAISAPDGPQWLALGAVVVATFVFLLVGDARQAIAPTRLAVSITVLGATLAAIVATVSFAERADPRSRRPAASQVQLVDLLSQSSAERRLVPPADLYEVRADGLQGPGLWRAAALDVYDGQIWASSGDLLPAGVEVSADTPTANATISITVLPGAPSILPVPGTVIRAGQVVETDEDRRIVRVVTDRRPATVDLTVEPSAALAPNEQVMVAALPPSDIENAYSPFATALVPSATTVSARVRAIAGEFITRYRFDPAAPGAGLQLGLLDRFLRDTERGTQEQFISGFVLLARSIGAEARVATGYRVDVSAGTATVTTADATSWAEVRAANGEWRSIDVLPEAVEPEADSAPDLGGAQSGVADQPPPAAEPEPAVDPVIDPDTAESTDRGRFGGLASTLATAGKVVGLFVLLPLVAVVLTIILIKRRRRVGLRSSDPGRRVVTAWALASDALVDAGAQLRHSTTNAELAAIGAEVQPAAASPLRTLSRHADSTVFSATRVPPEVAQHAVTALREIERSIARSSSWSWRARWWVSTRSLRRSTRSPLRDR
jgi:hypothetical protein